MKIEVNNLSKGYDSFKALFKNVESFSIPFYKEGSKLHKKSKSKPKIHIKEKNKGKFTESAKRAGRSVQEHAAAVLRDPNATSLQKKRANFARNAAKWKK